MKVLTILLLALVAGQMTGAAGFLVEDDCATECSDVDPGTCPEPCAFCLCCCPSQLCTPAAPVPLEMPHLAVRVAVAPDRMRASLHSFDIFHVPKPDLA